MIGKQIGHYEIVELMGVGGMGEVYRGRDLTLDRQVAIKVLPAEWADDPDRLARLQREAKVLAQLDHPNIAAIHGLEEAAVEGQPAQRLLVMQLAEGDTLHDWIVGGRLSTGSALEIGLQIAAGLDAALDVRVAAGVLTSHDASRGENAHYFPHMLPGSELFHYFARGDSPENSGIYMARVDGTEPPVRVVPSMSSATYAPPLESGPGHLMWVREGTLLAQPFDPDSGALSGSAQAVASGVRVEESQRAIFASVSNNGILAWADAHAAEHEVKTYSREGTETGTLPIEPGQVYSAQLSPSGDRILFNRVMQGTADIWLHDVGTDTSRVAVGSPGFDELVSWSADGRSFIYQSSPDGIFLVDSSGMAEARSLGGVGASGYAMLTPDDNYAVYPRASSDGSTSLQAVPTDGSGATIELVDGSTIAFSGGFSPDGEWMLVLSERSGTLELWAARWVVEESGPRLQEPWYQISTRGIGTDGIPRWTDDDEILYVTTDRTVMSLRIGRSGDGLQLGGETPLFAAPQDTLQIDFAYDGQEMLVLRAPYASEQTLHLLTHWQSRLSATR